MLGALSALVAQGTVDARALQPSPGPLAHGPRQSPAPLKRPAHADVKEPRVKPSHPDTTAEQHWTLSSRGCPPGRRNADAHECLQAVQEAVVGIYVVAGYKVLTNFENATEGGWSSSIPAGCTYSDVTQRAIFNHNQNNSNLHNAKDNYRHVCTNDDQKATSFTRFQAADPSAAPKAKPKAQLKARPSAELKAKLEAAAKKSASQTEEGAEPKKSGPPEKDAAGTLSASPATLAHEIGQFVAGNAQSHALKSEGGPFPQFVCDAPASVLETCPNIVASRAGAGPDLKVPASSRLLFAGPDHLMEVYAALLAANGGCASRENGTVCVLGNGAKMAFLRSLGAQETDALAASLASTHWTHGYFMEPHGPPFNQGEPLNVGERYWQVRQALARKHGSREELGGPDMCLPMAVKEGTPLDAKSGFAEYRKCLNSKPHLLRFRRLLRGAGRTLAVPWHVPPPADHESLQHTYFTRPWAVMMDCRPELRPRPEAASRASSSVHLYEYANGDVFMGEQSEDDVAEAALAADLDQGDQGDQDLDLRDLELESPTPSATGTASKAATAQARPRASPVPSPQGGVKRTAPSPSPSAGGKGAQGSKAKAPTSFYRSLAKRNPHGVRPEGAAFNPMEGQILTDLQCVSVCEPAGAGEGPSCYHGAVAWMAHDLLALAR